MVKKQPRKAATRPRTQARKQTKAKVHTLPRITRGPSSQTSAPNNRGICGIFTGSSGSGKTTSLQQRLARAPRCCVWSIKETVDNYAGVWNDTVIIRGSIDNLDAELFKDSGARPVHHVVFIPDNLKDFSAWGHLVHAWGECGMDARLMTDVVAEELSATTSPGKAPEGWGRLVREGMGRSINIYAVTQRPAESDKTVMGNATFYHAHRMMLEIDRKYMASIMGIFPDSLGEELQNFRWIERHADGRLVFGP